MAKDPMLDAELAKLPLRQNVRWIDLSFLFPGTICEQTKNPELGLFGAIDLECPECAAKVVEYHNSQLPKEVQDVEAHQEG